MRACVTSDRDPLVLDSLPPPLVVEDGLDLVDVLSGKANTGGCQAPSFHRRYRIVITGRSNTTTAKCVTVCFFFSPMLFIYFFFLFLLASAEHSSVFNLLSC